MKILLIDDDELYLKAVSSKLIKMGHHVYMAKDASDALREVAFHIPDIVLTDIMMPGMSGLELMNILRLQLPASTPFIMMSCWEDPNVVKASFQLGADAYIHKPLNVVELAAQLKKYEC